MRDFEQEVSNAAGPLPPIQTEEFSWSLARHYLFRFCRRAYFIRYYLAQGGWDAYSHTLAREAYFSKYLMPFDTWLSRTLRDSIREAFAKMSAGSPGHKRRGFGFYLLRQIGKATADLQMSLKNREYLYDAKRPAILEHHLGIGDFADVDKLTDMAVSILGDAYAMLSRSDIIADLANISFVDLRTDDVFISIDYKGFPVWLVPGLIYFHKGAASAIDAEVRLTGGENTTDFFARIGRLNSLFALYCARRYPGFPVNITTFTFSKELSSVVYNLFEPDIESLIDKSSAEMLALVDKDGLAHPEDFPPCENRDACRTCRYQSACRLLESAMQGKQV